LKRGPGPADSPQDEKIYTIPRSIDEVDAARKALGLDRIVLYGQSWGSVLAIEYLCQHPRRQVRVGPTRRPVWPTRSLLQPRPHR
jgi:pimeloyl-ACP methyl ester carboxylesterase